MKSIREDVAQKGILVSDGGWGTFLVAAGLGPGECPELWNIDHPDVVRSIAKSYADAGADIVMTNSFGGSRITLEPHGLADRASELNEVAARLSREVAGETIHVLASMGPTGKLLMMGDVTEEQLYNAFAEQAIALERGGADACSVETMAALDEAAIAVRAVKENTALEVVASFTFNMHTDTGYRTMMGVSIADMAAGMLSEGADILGANCSLGPIERIEVIRDLRAAAPTIPILVHPNAGMPHRADDGCVTYPETPEMMASRVPELVKAGANIIGGCCGTGPGHIRAIVAAVRDGRRSTRKS
ncbi:MAG: homocysteine S-methyltransferase family protein [Candidatus Hydrogenedentes bacterium]|nr:homocysteine S-methyltransferase family protein [Candidatus Hydrogenedentota bacterium]